MCRYTSFISIIILILCYLDKITQTSAYPDYLQQIKNIGLGTDYHLKKNLMGIPGFKREAPADSTASEEPDGKQENPTIPGLPPIKSLIKPNETEAERAERIHNTFEKLLTFVEIVGQVDNYFSNKWKGFVKTVSNYYDDDGTSNDDRVGSRNQRKIGKSCT